MDDTIQHKDFEYSAETGLESSGLSLKKRQQIASRGSTAAHSPNHTR
jgi:hypothetical protein